MNRLSLIGALLGSIAFSAVSSAQVGGIYVEYWTGTDWVPVSGYADIDNNETGLPSGSNVTISGAGVDPCRIYAAFPSTEDIGDIRIDASTGTQSVFLTVGKFTDSNRKPTDVKALDVAGARDIGEIESLLGRTEIQARASRDYTDDVSA